ncbi:hypothetical protein BH10CYA1_BH10CYA1_46350 [soil metagenome]
MEFDLTDRLGYRVRYSVSTKVQGTIVASCLFVFVATIQCNTKIWAQNNMTASVKSKENDARLEQNARKLAASANALYAKAQFKPAEPIVAELLDVLKQIPKFVDNSVAQAMANRADLYYYANDSKACIQLYQQELKMRDALHWEQFKDRDEKFKIICERHRLAISYTSLKDFRAAEPLFKRTLSEFQTWNGSTKTDGTTVSVSALYAQCLRQLGKTKAAEALEAEVNKYNTEHPMVGRD